MLVEMQADGTFIKEYALPGNDQEGIAVVVPEGAPKALVYIAEDSGPEVWVYDDYPVI